MLVWGQAKTACLLQKAPRGEGGVQGRGAIGMLVTWNVSALAVEAVGREGLWVEGCGGQGLMFALLSFLPPLPPRSPEQAILLRLLTLPASCPPPVYQPLLGPLHHRCHRAECGYYGHGTLPAAPGKNKSRANSLGTSPDEATT